MIVSMLMFNILTLVFLSVSYDGIPVWLRIVLYAILFISEITAYASEDNLRNKIERLENEVNNLKKGNDRGMNWLEIASKMVEQNNDCVKVAPLSNITGVDIKFNKGYGTIKINVPADVANDLTNGSCKYVGGFLLLDREIYERLKGGME